MKAASLDHTFVRATNTWPGLAGGTELSLARFHRDAEKAAKVHKGTQPLTADDVAQTFGWVVAMQADVNANRIGMTLSCQGRGAFMVKRQGT